MRGLNRWFVTRPRCYNRPVGLLARRGETAREPGTNQWSLAWADPSAEYGVLSAASGRPPASQSLPRHTVALYLDKGVGLCAHCLGYSIKPG